MAQDAEFGGLPGQVLEHLEDLVVRVSVGVQVFVTPQGHADKVYGSLLNVVQVLLKLSYQVISVQLQSFQKLRKIRFLIGLILGSF